MILFFDTETTGIPKRYDAPISDVENYPRLVQLGFIVIDPDNENTTLLEREYLVRPDGWEIPVEASNVHKITTEIARKEGFPVDLVLDDLAFWVGVCDVIAGHNISFDLSVIGAEWWRLHQMDLFEGKKTVCTMKSSTDFCAIPSPFKTHRGYKYPKLHELYRKLFNEDMGAAHTALQDIQNTAKCYFALVEKGIIK